MNNQNPEHRRPIFFPFARGIQKGGGISQILLDIGSLPLAVFLHRGLGPRACGFLKILCIYLIMMGFFFVASNGIKIWKYWLLNPMGYQISFIWYMAMVMALARYHKIVALWRKWQGNPIHSYEKGAFLPIFKLIPVGDTLVYMVVEPICCFSIAVLFFDNWTILQVWVIACSVALFLSNILEWLIKGWWHLDVADGVIESDNANNLNIRSRFPNL